MPQQVQQQRRPSFAPSYNAVQINLDTPTLNAPPAMPYYPPVNMGPYQPPVQTPPEQTTQVPTQVPQTPQAPQAPVNVPEPVLDNPQQPKVDTQQPQVEVQKPDENGPESLAEQAFKGLSSPDYDTQALAMEEIAKKGLKNQVDVEPYVQENIFDKLIDIMNVDSSKLPGPTQELVDLRNKVDANDAARENAKAAGQDPEKVKLPYDLTPEQVAQANTLTPFEQVERNKEYALFTTAILQKAYGDAIEKQTGSVVPLTELPGARAVITQLKTNDSSDIANSAIDALRYVQRPEYKDDLTTLYTIAQNDARPEVAEAATQALAALNQPQAAEGPTQAA